MKRLGIVALIAVCSIGVVRGQQGATSARVQLEAAIKKEVMDGDLKAAIDRYKSIVAQYSKSDRAVAASALLRLAECYQKVGDGEARTTYERIAREFSDQKDAAATARTRLGRVNERRSKDSQAWVLDDQQILGHVSPEGRYLPYVEWSRTQSGGDLYLHDLTNGSDRRLTEPAQGESPRESAFSPDGRQLAYAWLANGRSEVRVLNVQEPGPSHPRTLFSNQDIETISVDDWSADGTGLAVHLRRKDRTAQVGVISVRSGTLRVLKTVDWRGPTKVLFSPDGRFVVFDPPSSDATGQRDIEVLAVDGTREISAVVDPNEDTLAGWTPDGKRLLFFSDRTGPSSLWALPFADGKPQGEPELVIPDFAGAGLGVTRSGQIFALRSAPTFFGGSSSDIQVGVFDFASSRFLSSPVRAVPDFVGSNGSPDWSLDGNLLAYVSRRESGAAIVIRSMQTGKVVREFKPGIELYGDRDALIRWAPGGRSFAAQGTDSKGRLGIHQILIDTGAVTPLALVRTEDPGELVRGAAWSPDGRKLYYQRRAYSTANWNDESRDSIVELDLTSGAERIVFQSAAFWEFWLSPDGRYIVTRKAQHNANTTLSAMMLVAIATGETTELMRGEAGGGLGLWTWAPDSQSVFLKKQGPAGSSELWRVPTRGGAAQKLALTLDSAMSDPRVSPDGKHLAFSVRKTAKSQEVWVLENFLALKASR